MAFPLNEEQQTAVDARGGAVVCVAGPGTGKTEVTAKRYIKLLQSGVSPDKIISLTFTDSGAKNMGERAGLGSSQTVFRTFHSYCLGVLRKEREHLPYDLRPEIIGLQPDIFDLVCEICRILNNRLRYADIVEAVSYYKMAGLTPDQALENAVGAEMFGAMAYKEYETKSKERGWLDFDSLIIETVKLFESNESVLRRNQFQEVQLDEAQDTDKNQFKLIKLITKKHGNIFIVGDENQLIYEFRSAMPGSLSNFHQYFPGTRKLFLGTNYRSTRRLVEFFKKIIPVDNRLADHMRPAPGAEEGYDPSFTKYNSDFEEMEKTLDHVVDPENTAILARTNRQLWDFENACVRRNIKFRMLGKTGFWDNGETKKLVDLVKAGTRPSEPAGPAVRRIIEQSRLIQTYRVPFKFRRKNPEENINSAQLIASRFDTVDEFLKHVNKAKHAHKNRSGMILSTVHQMKGKEAGHVFVTGVSQDLMPHESGDLPEERRIFFVAATRACKFLHFSYTEPASMFIAPFLQDSQSIDEQRATIPGMQQRLF